MEPKMRKKHRSRRHCSVPQCKSRCTSEISLFLFPKSKELAKKWEAILNISQRLFKYTYVCSLHFDNSDFTLAMSAKKRRLKIGAIPSKNLPNSKETQPFEDGARKLRKKISKRISSEKMLKDEAKSSEVLAECRACLQPCPRGERRELFKCWDPPWTGMENTVAEDLVKLTNVQISETDRHSKILCQNCYIILQKANHFVEIVRKADQVLNQRYLNDDSKPIENNNWPKPIKVDTNLCLYDNVEIKDECLSDEEYGHVNGDDGQDFSKVDVKIEAEEWHPQQPMLLNGAIAFNHLNEELAKINGCSSAEEHNGTKSLLNEHLRPNNGNGMRYESDEADTNSLETRIKDEPSSDLEMESSVASDLPLECLLCSKSFLSISGLKAHVIAQHSYKTVRRKSNDDNMEENQFKYVCKICQRRFETSTDLMVHETCHNKCVCYGCNASFETFDLLTQHRRSCKAVNNKEVGKVLKLEDVQRLANVAQRILEVITKYTIFCQDSEQGNIDECYQALLAVITQKEDSICDELSDTENFCDLSDIDSIDDTLLEYDKHFLSDLDCSETSLNAVIEKTHLNSFDKTDDGFHSMDGTLKIIAKASYPVVKLTRLEIATLDNNLSRNIDINEHSIISLDDSCDSFEEVTYLDSSILVMSDDTCSNVQSSADESDTISNETLSPRYFEKISDSNGIVVKSDQNNVISEEVAINRDLSEPKSNMTFNSADNISKHIAEEKATDRNKLSSGACLSSAFSPNPAAVEINIDDTGFDEFDDEFHSDDVSVCLDILSKYVTEDNADNNASDKVDPNVPIDKSSVDTFNLIFQERSSRNDAPVNLPIDYKCDPVAEICDNTNIDKLDKSYLNDVAPNASSNAINCAEESTSASKLIEGNAAVRNISAVSSDKVCEDVDNVTEGKSYDSINEDIYANNISVCRANMSNLEGETPVNDCDTDKFNEELDICRSISPINDSDLIQEPPFKGFENIHNNPNSNDFSNNAYKKIFEETADLYTNNFSICTKNSPNIINPYTDITGSSMDSPSISIQHKQKICGKSNYNYKPRIVEKDYTFIFKSTLSRKLIPGCYSYCKYKCRNNITPQQRINMCEKFWKMDLKTQRKFVNNNIHLNNQGYHTFGGKKRRTFINYVYILQISNQCVRVCKKFFEDTLSIVIVFSSRKQIRPDKDPKRRKKKLLKLDSYKNTHKEHKQYSHILDNNQLNPYVKLIDIQIDKELRSYGSQVLGNTNDTNHSKDVKESNLDAVEHCDSTEVDIETNSYDTAFFHSEIQSHLSTNVTNTNIDYCITDSDNRSFLETNSNSFKIESGIIQPDIDASKHNIDDNTNNSKLDSESNHFIIDNYQQYFDTELNTDNDQAINDINYLCSETNLLNIDENQRDTVDSRFNNDNSQIDSATKLLNNDKNQRDTVDSLFDNDNNQIDSEAILFKNDENQRDTVNSRFDNDNNQIDSAIKLLNNDKNQRDTDDSLFDNDNNQIDSEAILFKNDENQRDTVNSRFDTDTNQIDSETNLLNDDENQTDTVDSRFDNDNNQIDSETILFNNDEDQGDTVHSRLDNDNNLIDSETNLLNIDKNQPDTDIAITQIDTDHNKLDIKKIKSDDNNHLDIPTDKLYIDKNQFVNKTDQLLNNQSHGNVNCIADVVNKLDICPDFDRSCDSKETNNDVIESETDIDHLNTNPEPVSYNSYIDNIDRLDTDIYQCAGVVHQFFDETNKPHVGSDKSDTNRYNNQTNGGNNSIEINNHESTISQQEIDKNQSVIKMLTTDTEKQDDVMSNSQCQQIHYQTSHQLTTNTSHFDTATDVFETDINQSTEAVIIQHNTDNKQAYKSVNRIVTDTNKLYIRSQDIDTCRDTDTEVTEIGIKESITSTNLLKTGMTQSDINIHQQVSDVISLDISKSDIHVYQSETNQDSKELEIYCNQSTTCGSNQLDSVTNQCFLINNPSITDTSIPNICIDDAMMTMTATDASMFDTETKSSNSNYHVEQNTYDISNNTSDIFNPDSCANNREPKNNISTVQSDACIDQLVTDIYKPDIDSDDQKDSDRSNYFQHHMKANKKVHESGIHLSDFDVYQSKFYSLIKSKIATQQANCSTINNYVDTAHVETRKKNHKNKLQRIIGKGYKFMFRYKATRCVMPGCYNCKYKCISNITHEQRRNIFKEFWNMNLEAQTMFLNNNVLLLNPFGHPKLEGVRSKLNHSFFLPLNNQRVRVCKKFFVNTLSIYMVDIDKHNCYISAVKCRMDPYVKLIDITLDKKLSSYLVPEPSANNSLSLNMNNYQSEDDYISFYSIHPDRVIRLPKVDIFENTSSCFNTQSSNLNPVETYTFDTQLSHKQSQLSDTYIQPISVDVCQTGIDKFSNSENQSPKYTQLSNVDSQPIIKHTCLSSTGTCSSYSDSQSSDRYTNLINVETQRNMDVCHFSEDKCYSNLGQNTRGIRVQSSNGEAQSFKAILKDWASTQILNTNIESQNPNIYSSNIYSNTPLLNICNKSIDMQETDLGIGTTAVETSQPNINSYISGIDIQLPKLDDQTQRVDSGNTTLKHPLSFHTQSYEIASNINKCPSTTVKDRFSFDTQSCEIDCQLQIVGNSHETAEIYPSSLNNLKCETDNKNSNRDLRAVKSISFNSQTGCNVYPLMIDGQNSSNASTDICKVGINTCSLGNDIQTPDVYKKSSGNTSPNIHQARKDALGFDIQSFKLDDQVQSVDKCLTLTETQHHIDTQSCRIKKVIPCLDNNHEILESNLDSQSTDTDCQMNTFQVITKTNPSRIEQFDITNDDASKTNLYNDEPSDINQMGLNLLENSFNVNENDTNQTSIVDKFKVDCNTNQVDNGTPSNITLLDPCESNQLLNEHSIALGIEPHAIDNVPTIPATIVTHPPCLDNQFSNVDIENVNYVNNQATFLTEPFDSVVSQLQSKQHVQQVNNQVQTISTDFCQDTIHSSSSIYTTLSNTNSGDPYVNSQCQIVENYMSNVDRQLISEVTNQSGMETYPSFFDTKSSILSRDDRTNFESAPSVQYQSSNQYTLLSNFYSQPTSVECLQTEIETYPLNYDSQSKKYAELSHIESQSNEIDSFHTSLDEIDSCQASFDTHNVNIATADVVAQSFKSILNDWAS